VEKEIASSCTGTLSVLVYRNASDSIYITKGCSVCILTPSYHLCHDLKSDGFWSKIVYVFCVSKPVLFSQSILPFHRYASFNFRIKQHCILCVTVISHGV
jgi:hypothetical protein